MNKKLLTLVLAGMALGLVACGETPTTVEPTSDPEPTTVEPTSEADPDDDILALDTYDAMNVAGEFQCHNGELMAKAAWGYAEHSVMEAASFNMVKAINGVDGGEGQALYTALKERSVKGLYIFEGIEVGSEAAQAEAGSWQATAKINDEFVKLNSSYALKVIGCEYDAEDDTWTANWLIDKGSYAEPLNGQIDLSFPHAEEKDEGDRDWTANPVIINGAGIYTVVYAEYDGLVGDCHCGLAVVKTTALQEPVHEAYAVENVSLIGAFDEHNWDFDEDFTPDNEGKWALNIELAAGDQVKVRINHDWAYSYGIGALTEETTSFSDAGGNFEVLEGGLFHFEISFNNAEDLSEDESLALFTVSVAL